MLDIRVCSRGLIKYNDTYLYTIFTIKGNTFPLLVGGKVEYYESPIRAMVRELAEETHLRASKVAFLSNYNVECTNKQACDFIAGWLFLVEVTSIEGFIPEDEIHLYKWVSYNEMKKDFPMLPDEEPSLLKLGYELTSNLASEFF